MVKLIPKSSPKPGTFSREVVLLVFVVPDSVEVVSVLFDDFLAPESELSFAVPASSFDSSFSSGVVRQDRSRGRLGY